MKKQLVLLICMVFAFTTMYAKDAKPKKETVTFFIEEMDCDHCVKKIEKNIAFEKGVTNLKCDLAKQTVEVTYKNDKTSKTKLIAAFKKIEMTAVAVDKGAGCNLKATGKSTKAADKHDHK